MTAYNKNPYPIGPPPVLMIGGRTEWLYGNQLDNVSSTSFAITLLAVAANVVTITGTLLSGNIPAVGALISVQGTQTDSGAANVTNAVISAVSISALTGQGTISYAATATNQSATADSGVAIVPAPITYDTLVNGSSRQAASAENDPSTNDERSYFVQVFFGTLPTACVVTIQGSLVDTDSAYQNIGTVVTVAGSAATVNNTTFPNLNLKFVRLNVSGLSGSGTIAAALMG